MKKKFVILMIALIFIFGMFAPIFPVFLIYHQQPCGFSFCDRGIVSLYEMILNWEYTLTPHYS